jgi:hypothetical protein
MISAISKIIILILLLVFTSGAQTSLQNQYKIASQLYESENYFDAVTEFKRLVFFDSNNDYSFQANYFIGESYKAGGRFSDAIRHFILAELSAESADQIYTAKIGNIKTNILRRTTDQSIRLIDEMLNDTRFFDKKNELIYWKGWSYIFSNNWKEASEEFYKLNSDHELYRLTSSIEDSLYSESLAKILSYVIPGAGQFYTGEYISGLLSLGWNVILGYLSINAFIEERVFDGLVITNFLWLRFYNGNIQNAEKFANEKNIKVVNRALDFLLYNYKGEKP